MVITRPSNNFTSSCQVMVSAHPPNIGTAASTKPNVIRLNICVRFIMLRSLSVSFGIRYRSMQ
jgi:hypothetical protein